MINHSIFFSLLECYSSGCNW